MKILTSHLDLFESLNREGVEYLLIGGVVAIAYGVPRTTQDIDLLINPTIDNAKKILAVFLKTPFEGGRHQARVDKIEVSAKN